jgi:acylphosphatase
MKTVKILVKGTVQGVFFRNFIKEKADANDIDGFVRNLENGDLEIVAEGKDEEVNNLIEECKKGPPHSEIRELLTEEIKHQGLKDFKILKI